MFPVSFLSTTFFRFRRFCINFSLNVLQRAGKERERENHSHCHPFCRLSGHVLSFHPSLLLMINSSPKQVSSLSDPASNFYLHFLLLSFSSLIFFLFFHSLLVNQGNPLEIEFNSVEDTIDRFEMKKERKT